MYISSVSVFILYLLLFIIIYKIPTSLSDTYYVLEESKKGIFFTIMMFVIGFTIAPVVLEFTPEDYKFLGFFSVIGILFTGAAPLFKSASQKVVHFVSAGISAVASLLWIIFVASEYYYIVLLLSLLGYILYLFDKKSYLFYGEMVIFFSYYIILGLYLY